MNAMAQTEIWIPYISFSNSINLKIRSFVYVSNLGHVKGYLWNFKPFSQDMIRIYKTGRTVISGTYLYKLVDEVFRGPLPSNVCVHHINENKLDDSLDNLERITKSEHSSEHLKKRRRNGEYLSAARGRKAYYLGESIRFFKSTDIIPDGWLPGYPESYHTKLSEAMKKRYSR